MKTTAVLGAVIALCVGLVPRSTSGDPPRRPAGDKPKKADSKVVELMREKLGHSQKVLEGITQNDLKEVEKHARALLALSRKAEWQVIQTPFYMHHSEEFQNFAERLIQKAQEKNLDGATLSYLGMTLTCVKCHKYVREVRMTRLDDGCERRLAE